MIKFVNFYANPSKPPQFMLSYSKMHFHGRVIRQWQKKAKRKASAPPMGYNARKKMNKHRPLTQKEKRLILIGIGVLVLAAILFAIFYDDGSLPMRGEDVVTEGAQQMLSYAVDSETGASAPLSPVRTTWPC